MSYAAIDAAFGVSLPPAQKITLLALAWRQNATTGDTFPTVERISADTGLSRRTVLRALDELERGGHIARTRSRSKTGRQIPNAYRLHLKPTESAPETECHHDTRNDEPSAMVTPSRVPSCHEAECHHDTQTRKEENTEGEHGKKKTRAKASPSALPAPEDVPQQVWSDWLELRRAKRAPVTETVVAAARSEAEKAGMPFESFLQIWCMRGSQGLQAAWLKPEEMRGAARTVEPAWRAEERRRMQQAVPSIAERSPSSPLTIDATTSQLKPQMYSRAGEQTRVNAEAAKLLIFGKQSRHHGINETDFTEGVNPDGTF